jgi:putative MFS transporter
MLGIILVLAFFLESVDFRAIGYFLPYFTKEFTLTPTQAGYFGSLSQGGMVIGALFAGWLSDRFGRKKVLIGAIITWGIFGILQTFAGSYEMLMVARLGIGLGVGAHMPVEITMLAEIVPSKLRAKYITACMCCSMLGFALAGILTWLFIPYIGWRGVSFVMAAFALLVIVIAKVLPESALWLESKGRFAEADAIMTKMEQKTAKALGHALPPVEIPAEEDTVKVEEKGSLRELFSKKILRTTVMVTLWWFFLMLATNGLGIWLTSLFVAKGFTISKATGFVALTYTVAIFSYPIVQFLLKRCGRKWTAVIALFLTAIFSYLYGFAPTVPLMIMFGMVYSVFNACVSMTVNTYLPELFPTRIRNTGTGYGNAMGKVGGLVGPIIFGLIMTASGPMAVFAFAAGSFAVTALVIAVLGKETSGKIFEQ